MRSRILSFSLVLLMLMTLSCPVFVADIAVSAHAAVLMEPTSGDVVYARNGTERLPMASTTKIMTTLVALKKAEDLKRSYAIPQEAVGIEGSSIYLQAGEHLTLEELLYGVMLESANDAATAVAILVSGSVEDFANEMNAMAVSLGLADTHFTNPHGLDDPEHYTTALDLARLAAYALDDPTFAKIVSTTRYTIPLQDGEGTRVLVNHNRLLRHYTDVIGVKTGFTKTSGRCLVSAAEQNGVRMVAVTLDAPDDWQDHRTLLDYGFTKYETVTLAAPGEISVSLPCVGGELTAANTDGLTLVLPVGTTITQTVESRGLWFPPVKCGQTVGYVRFFANGKEIGTLPLCAADGVDAPIKERGILDKILDF